jgi:hypothetical protein
VLSTVIDEFAEPSLDVAGALVLQGEASKLPTRVGMTLVAADRSWHGVGGCRWSEVGVATGRSGPHWLALFVGERDGAEEKKEEDEPM